MDVEADRVEPDGLAGAAPPTRLLLSVREVAAALAVSERHVWRLSDRGELPRPISLGRLKRWRRSSIDDWLNKAAAKARREA